MDLSPYQPLTHCISVDLTYIRKAFIGMSMRKFLLLFGFSIFFHLVSNAQFRYDYGYRLGAANYLGDIGGKNLPRRDFVVDMHMSSSRWATGAYIRRRKNKRFAWSATLDYLRIQDSDKLTTYFPRRARNLTFRNDMVELAGRAEYTLYYDSDLSNRGYFNPDMKIYIFGGIAGVYSNPKGYINSYAADYIASETGNPASDYYGKWYSLRKWGTEGQEKAYSPFNLAIPLGLGTYFTYNKTWRFGFEYCWRATFTDYLDDISGTYPDAITAANSSEIAIADGYVYHSYDESYVNSSSTNPDGIVAENFWVAGSPRGNPLNNDNYMTFQVYVGKIIRTKSNFYKSKYGFMKGRSGGGRRKGGTIIF